MRTLLEREPPQPRGAQSFLVKQQQWVPLLESVRTTSHPTLSIWSAEKLCSVSASSPVSQKCSRPCSTLGIKDLGKIPHPAEVRGSFPTYFTEAETHHFSPPCLRLPKAPSGGGLAPHIYSDCYLLLF